MELEEFPLDSVSRFKLKFHLEMSLKKKNFLVLSVFLLYISCMSRGIGLKTKFLKLPHFDTFNITFQRIYHTKLGPQIEHHRNLSTYSSK
jgi:hypothetical protein